MTVCSYTTKKGFIAVAGVEGKIQMFDLSAKVKVAQSDKHAAEVIGLYFYDE